MTFARYAAARQLLAEEQVGRPLREYRRQQAAKDARSIANLRADTQRQRERRDDS